MVDQVWGKHATVVTGDQGSEQVSKNEWNENLNRKGLLGFDSETIASASEITIPDDTNDDVSSFIKLSGVADVDKFIVTNTSDGDLLYIITTGSATLVNVTSPSTGEIRLLANDDKDLSTTVPTVLMRVGNSWYEYGGEINTAHTVDAGDLTGTTLASGVVTTSATTVGALNSGSITSGFGNIDIGSSDFDTSGTVTCDVTGDVSGSSGSCTGNSATATTATNATNVALTNEATDTTCFPLFTAAATGNENALTNATLTFDSNTANLATTTFTGALAGNASTATTAGTVTTAAQGAITSVGTLTSLGVGAITTSGLLTMGDNIITGIKSLDMDIDVLTYGATTNIDFDDNEVETLALTGNIIFTDSNNAIGKHKVIHMVSDASIRTFTFPTDWVFYGTEPTATVASKKSILSLVCLGSAEADVRAVFVEEA